MSASPKTFIVLGLVYFCFMMVGAAIVRLPPPGWAPAGYVPPSESSKLITTKNVFVYQALKTPQFWLIWWVLCLNVTAGIGVLGQASAMSQEMFPGKVTVTAAAGFVGLMSLFNMGGRFFWASVSDYIGRKNTYFVFFFLGVLLYSLVPQTGEMGSVALFVLCFCIIMSMYGGGFATVPAYLRDMFGTRYVGAIHGLLLTAWSMAGIFGPVLVNYIRQYNVEHGVAKADAYDDTMYVMAALLVVGFFCNLFIQAVHERHHMQHEEADAMGMALRELQHDPYDNTAASRACLGIRRNSACVGGDPDGAQCAEAVPVAALLRRRKLLMHDAEQARLQRRIRLQRLRAALIRDLAIDQHIGAIGDRQHRLGVVLDNDHRGATAQAHQRVHHLLHDCRRQALERFIQQDQPARHHQRTRDRQHLPLAA